MFALGCILYEVTTGQKLFQDDWNIREYSLSGDPIFPTLWPRCDPGSRLYSLGKLAQWLLDVDPFNRPSALQTKAALELIRQDKGPRFGTFEITGHNRIKRGRQPSPPRTVNVAQVQYRRSLPSFINPSNVNQLVEFSLLHSLPPSFGNLGIPQPRPDSTPPPPQTPFLRNLASGMYGKGENYSDDALKAIIIKAQPHHSFQSLSHLKREQLVNHVNDLVIWWKQVHPQQASHAQVNPQQHVEQEQTTTQARHTQRLQPVATVAASAAAPRNAAANAFGLCPCCCEAKQNAAFSPCGHLYACTRCAHRLYDGGRGKCPVCRVQIQTYLRMILRS